MVTETEWTGPDGRRYLIRQVVENIDDVPGYEVATAAFGRGADGKWVTRPTVLISTVADPNGSPGAVDVSSYGDNWREDVLSSELDRVREMLNPPEGSLHP